MRRDRDRAIWKMTVLFYTILSPVCISPVVTDGTSEEEPLYTFYLAIASFNSLIQILNHYLFLGDTPLSINIMSGNVFRGRHGLDLEHTTTSNSQCRPSAINTMNQ